MNKFAVILAIFTGSVAFAAEPDPVVLEPANNWELNYASERCRLTRTFGTGKSAIDLTLERFEPGVQFRLILGGLPLRNHLRATRATLHFGPSEAAQELNFTGATGGGSVPLWIFRGSTRIAAAQVADEDDIRFITPEREAAVKFIEIDRPLAKTHRLQTGSMGPAFAALRKCTDDVLTHWGFDVAKHKTMTRRPTPTSSPGDWVTAADYPTPAVRARVSGLVEFRLDVDEEGKATACHIQKTVRTIGFDDAVCAALMKRASFKPALDADGKPMRSYWRNTVYFEA